MSRFKSPRSEARRQALNRLRELEREREVILEHFAELSTADARHDRAGRLARLRRLPNQEKQAAETCLPSEIPHFIRSRCH